MILLPKVIPLSFCAISFLVSIAFTAGLSNTPSLHWLVVLTLLALLLLLLNPSNLVLLIFVASAGCCWMSFNIQQHFKHALPSNMEGNKIIATGTITSLVEISAAKGSSFEFTINKIASNKSDWMLPAKVMLNWKNSSQRLRPGDNWQLLIKVKKPRNYANPGSFDLEKFCMQQRIVAVGYVVAAGENLFIGHNVLKAPLNNIRQYILELIQINLAHRQFTAVIIALVLGVKQNMPAEQIQVFQRSGVAHLMAISGLHLGVIATMVFATLLKLWKYAPSRWINIAAPWIAACGALVVSIGYALLAGFAVATQRSLIMLAIFLSGYIFKRNLASRHGFFLALMVVLLLDPFAVLSLGFWFSFVAVGFLIYTGMGRTKSKNSFNKVLGWCKPQLVIAISLLPVSLVFFSQTAVIAPITNIIAIPWVSFTVVPLGLLAIMLLPLSQSLTIYFLKIAENCFSLLWPLLKWFAKFEVYHWQPPDNFLWLYVVIAVMGAIWLFIPIGMASRWWGILNLLPLLFSSSSPIPYGTAEFTLLDVGQGLSVVIRTQQHSLVYDTGAKFSDHFDLGDKVVVPYLHHIGIKYLSALMISHGDNDHIGGARSVLKAIAANSVITSDPNDLVEFKPQICSAGQQWQWDGVMFSVLHPQPGIYNSKRNNHCCVLMIQAGEHKVLLTGDIEASGEQQLIQKYGASLKVDVLLVPHHGSKTSSSWEFLEYTRPQYALIPVGYKNQYGHPKQEVLDRYAQIDAQVLSTVDAGAISFRLGRDLPAPQGFRRQRCWLN